MSLPPCTNVGDIRTSFCCHVHSFASREAGERWLVEHPGGVIIDVDESFGLGQDVALELLNEARELQHAMP